MIPAMSDHVLSYAPVRPRRPSRLATVSLWLGGLAHLLFPLAYFSYDLLAKPAMHLGTGETYRWYKMWFTIVPAWSAMSLAWVGAALAIAALAKASRSRGRAIVGLVLCLSVYIWLAVA